ncbi:MAG: hypothetical protein ACJ8AD_06930, partial [Gemmatimonadaceae bacterium]
QKETENRLQASADSARRVDSLAGKVLPPRRLVAAPPKPGVATPSIPAPFTVLLLRTARPLSPNTPYMLRVDSARALSGRSATSERSFTTPKPPPPKPDSTRAPARAPAPSPRP